MDRAAPGRLGLSFAVVATAVTLVLAGCASGSSSDGASGGDAGTKGSTITIENFQFHPRTLTAEPGTTITVRNQDDTKHTVTADDGSFDTKPIEGGSTAKVTVERAGTFAYHCDIHNYMTGTIEVTG